MDASLGRITAELAEPSSTRLSELVELINRNVKPPVPVTEADVHIRAMYIVSDQVNSFGGRFPHEEMQRLVNLMVDSPVLVGHRKDKLPVARNFHAEMTDREGKTWVKCYFYWLRSAQGVGDLKENIDGGIYKECSIGFTYLFPECSVCGKDIRTCGHQLFEDSPSGQDGHVCHFNYRQIERVLETSLVYRGAVAETSVSKDLKMASTFTGEVTTISEVAELDQNQQYVVIPFYDGIDVLVSCSEGNLSLKDLDNQGEALVLSDRVSGTNLPNMTGVFGQLVGYRGKERCSRSQLVKYLEKNNGGVTRVELKLLTTEDITPGVNSDQQGRFTVRNMRRREASGIVALNACAKNLTTKNGVRIFKQEALPPQHAGYRYYPPDKSAGAVDGCYELTAQDDGDDATMEVTFDAEELCFRVRQFNLARLSRGARFLADIMTRSADGCSKRGVRAIQGTLKGVHRDNGGLVLQPDGGLAGRLVFRPIKLHGQHRYLFYQLPASE